MKLLVVDDHPIFRKGLADTVSSIIENCTVSEADNGKDAIELIKNNSFNLIMLDIDMPEMSGLDVLNYIFDHSINTKCIIFSMHNDELFFNEALDRGAMGYILKEDSSVEIKDCLDNVLNDTPFVSQKLKPFVENRKRFRETLHEVQEHISSLTKSEYSTLKLVAQNKTSKEIAEILFVTEKSVENYRSRICKKLNLSGESHILNKWVKEYKSLLR